VKAAGGVGTAPANGPSESRTVEPPAMPPTLAITDLQVTFSGHGPAIHAVNGVSFSVGAGQALAIVGESGSGKSVTARAIMGLLPPETTKLTGSVRLRGHELVGLSDRQLRIFRGREMALVFQDPARSLDPTMRVGDQITEALRSDGGLRRAQARSEAIELLGKVRLPAPRRRFYEYPHQLSGGMRQRVMIAIAISRRPRVLIADEPTTALDVTTQAQLMDLVVELQEEFSMALVLISHDIGIAAAYTDQIAVMYAGRVVEQAPTAALLARMRMPYTRGLFDSIPRLADRAHEPLPVLSGRPPDPSVQQAGCPFQPRCPRATDRCPEELPPLQEHESGHHWACWNPL
jgi:oligopeptide/dipeptide ABC transporter ATP-binding protein